MKYSELQQLKKLLKTYTEDLTIYDNKDILFKMNEEVLESLAVITNHYLESGKTIENILTNRLFQELKFRIKELRLKDTIKGRFVDLNELDKKIELIFLNFNKDISQ